MKQSMLMPGRAFVRTDRVSQLLWGWRAASLDLKAYTGQGAALIARTSLGGHIVDRNGYLYPSGYSEPRFSMEDGDGDGVVDEVGYYFEGPTNSHTNICLQSENFATTWTVVGTITILDDQNLLIGTVALSRLTGPVTAGDYKAQGITFTGDTQKPVSIIARQGPTPPTNGSRVVLRDVTAAADRLSMLIRWNANGTPNVTATTGTYLGFMRLGKSCHRLLFLTTSVTAANTNSLRIIPCDSSEVSKDIWVGAVQVEDGAFTLYPTSYKKTTTTAVTVNPDTSSGANGVRWNLGLHRGPSALTLYLRFVQRKSGSDGDTAELIRVRDDGNAYVRIHQNGNVWKGELKDDALNVTTSTGTTVNNGVVKELTVSVMQGANLAFYLGDTLVSSAGTVNMPSFTSANLRVMLGSTQGNIGITYLEAKMVAGSALLSPKQIRALS